MQLKFKNKKFRIMQVSDPQDLQYVRKTMVRMLDTAYDSFSPDLVVFTGDNILGNHLCDARIGSRIVIKDKQGEEQAMRTAINHILAPLEKRGIPFAMIYGNHDDRNSLTKEEQADIYRSYSFNCGLDAEDSGDCDTYNLPIYSENGEKIAFNIWMIDSAWYDREQDRCFEMVKPQAIEWYKRKSNELKEDNGGVVVPSILFQHIPMQEILRLIEECDETQTGAVKGPDGKFFKLKDGVRGAFSEYPGVVSDGNGQFEAIKECGDVKAVVFGHDHPNCFTGTVDGIDFIQTSCASFRCYGDRTRGVRIFDINEDGTYETTFYTYKDICGEGVINELSYIWDADGMGKYKAALIVGGVVAVGAVGFAVSRFVKKYKSSKL